MFLKPTYYFDCATDISLEFLNKHKIKAILLDLDNTLTTHNNPVPPKSTLEWLDKMKSAGIKMMIVSNNSAKRVEPFAKELGLPFVSRGMKPLTKGFSEAIKKLEVKTDRQREILRLIGDMRSHTVVSDLLSKDNISYNDKLSLLDDIAPLSVKEITYQVNNNILNNVLNVINERLLSYSSLIVSDNNNNNMLLLLASNNNNDNNYKDIIRLKERRNNTYELWSKISYNYGHDFNNGNNNNNIHTIGITLGMDYNINNDKYKLGLSYSFNMSNGKEIISNIISSYG